jgi:hypothetical protein
MLFSCWFVGIISLVVPEERPSQSQVGAEPLASFEREIMDHPAEGLATARRAVGVLGKEENRLYRLAAKQQEKILLSLGLGQVTELAEVLEKKLDDPQASRRVRIGWLEQRGLGLSPPEVRRLLGSPRHFAVQILYRRQIERWSYDQPATLWLTFICTDGQTVRLQHVHSLSSEKP